MTPCRKPIRSSSRCLLAALVLGLGLLLAPGVQAIEYTVRDIALPIIGDNHYGVFATGLNNSGQVVGYRQYPRIEGGAEYEAFVTGANATGVTFLGTFGGSWSQALGINDAGQVVGTAAAAGGTGRAFLYNPGTGLVDLGTLGGSSSSATAINASGRVVGAASTTAGHEHAFITDPGGSNMRDLGTFGGLTSMASGINASGQVVGSAAIVGYRGPDFYHPKAFVTGPDGGPLQRIEVGGFDNDHPDFSSRGTAINDRGDVAGEFGTYFYESRPFFAAAGAAGHELDESAIVTFPPPSPSFRYSAVVSTLTETGEVGGGYRYGVYTGAYVTGPDGGAMLRLDDSKLVSPDGSYIGFMDVSASNDVGQLLVNGYSNHLYLLTPVPESAPVVLLLAGLGWMGAAARRRAGVPSFI